MPWRALTLRVDRAAADAFSDALLEAGAQSVAVELDGAVVALIALDQDSSALIDAAAHSAGISTPPYSSELVQDQDWVRASQAQFAPVLIGARLWIGPSWHAAPPGRIDVRIVPGLRSEEQKSELQSTCNLVFRLLIDKITQYYHTPVC